MRQVTLLIFNMYVLASSVCAQPETFTNSIGMEFILISPGSFTLGKFDPPYPSPSDTTKSKDHNLVMWMGDGRGYSTEEFAFARKLAEKDRRPGFEVNIHRPFYIGKFEVTQKQWRDVMGSNPSTFQSKEVPNADSHPVENISWEDAQQFIKELNRKDKTKRYRLPTEFEWEYAARAGEPEKDIAWKSIQETAHLGTKTTAVVGSKAPNAYGIYDMLGNVWEWVADYYNEKIFSDPKPPRKGNQHVLKGGSFTSDVKNATYMTHAAGPGNGWDVGFRIIMELNAKPE